MSFDAAFFGPGNRLRWAAIQEKSLQDGVTARLAPFLDNLKRARDVVVLPRVREDDGRVQWYVLCASERVARVSRDELRAFLGPSYSDFEGHPTNLDPSDLVDAAVLSRYGRSAFRVGVPDKSLVNTARERLLLMTHLRDERPLRTARRPRAVGRVLREFEYGLIARDGQAAAQCIQELRVAGQLGAKNLLFLEVRRLAALGQWRAVLELPELRALQEIARPRRVTEALIRAVYTVHLREFEEGVRVTQAHERFRSKIFPEFRDLFRTHAGLSGYEVDASFILVCSVSEAPSHGLSRTILAKYPEDAPGRPYLTALASLVPVPTTGEAPPDPLAEAQKAFALANVDRAYALASDLPPSFAACALLLRCASDMGTLAATRDALASVGRLPAVEKNRLMGHAVLRRIFNRLQAFVSPTVTPHPVERTPAEDVPSSWATWLRRLSGADPWKSAVAVAETAGREWNLETLVSEGEDIAEIAELILADRPPWGQNALRDALPHFLEFFLSRGPDMRLRPIYENLFVAIAVDDQVSLPQITALLRTAEARLRLGVSATEYEEIVDHLTTAIDNAESPSVVGVALDALDVLASEACPNTRRREDFLACVAAMFHRWYRRIDAAQWALLRRLADELQVPEAVGNEPPQQSTESAASIWTSLDHKRIALYSLREPALRRVQSILREICLNSRIEIFSDHVGGSPALRTASQNADIFVIATAAAKHAATNYIEANRAPSNTTLYARGQGSTSLLEVIRNFLKHGTR